MNRNKLLKRIIVIVLLILTITFLFIFFYMNKSKKMKFGNTMSSQEIINNILNISEYETVIEAEVKSNKNTNKYIMKQKYIAPNILEQEIIEPENIQGIKIIKKENELKVENTRLDISKIYNDYEYMTDNCLDLNTFIEEYKTSKESKYEEKDNQIIMSTQSQQNNKYINDKKLYIDKKTGNPTKMEIKDNSKNTTVYILYNEVKLNSNPLVCYSISK